MSKSLEVERDAEHAQVTPRDGENVPDGDDDIEVIFCDYKCSPDLAFQVGGVLYMRQFTDPVINFLREISAVRKPPSELRLRLQGQLKKSSLISALFNQISRPIPLHFKGIVFCDTTDGVESNQPLY